MISLILEAVKEWVEELLSHFIPKYDVMPSNEVLLAMPRFNNVSRPFYCEGYYTAADGNGGMYCVATFIDGGKKIGEVTYTDKGVTKTTNAYLIALDTNGKRTDFIDICRYGLRASVRTVNRADKTKENTFAETNSAVIKSLNNTKRNATLYIPAGNYFFAEPVVLGDSYRYNIVGETHNFRYGDKDTHLSEGYSQGTALIFPWLENGQTAVSVNTGTIKNVTIIGNPSTYNFYIDRTQLLKENLVRTDVEKETIGTIVDENNVTTQVKCTAIKKIGGKIDNVYVMHFYNGMEIEANAEITDFHASFCHYGFYSKNDTKFSGVYGLNVHTMGKVSGALTSIIQLRLDSGVHALNVTNGSNFTFEDIDGDWLTDSLIVLGDGEYITNSNTPKTISETIFSGIHGRCCTLKYYDSVDANNPVYTNAPRVTDSSTLKGGSLDGYGLIHITDKTTCRGIQFNINGVGGSLDGTATEGRQYRVPPIILTHGDTRSKIYDSKFICPMPDGYSDTLDLFHTGVDFDNTYDSLMEVYHLTDGNASSDSTDPTDIDFSDIKGV